MFNPFDIIEPIDPDFDDMGGDYGCARRGREG